MNSSNTQNKLLQKDEQRNTTKLSKKVILDRSLNQQTPYFNFPQVNEGLQDSNRIKGNQKINNLITNSIENNQNSQFISPKNVITGRKSSSFLTNYFSNQKNDYVLKTLNDKSSTDLYTSNYDQLYSPKTVMSGLTTPNTGNYAIYGNFMQQKDKKQGIDSSRVQSQVVKNIGEQTSISQRLNNLKKFYLAEGPLVDKSIVPKTSYLQYRGLNKQKLKSLKKPFNYSHDNLEILQPEIKIIKSEDSESKGFFNSHSTTALPQTPYQTSAQQSRHQKKYSLSQVNELYNENLQENQNNNKSRQYDQQQQFQNENKQSQNNNQSLVFMQQNQQNSQQNPSRSSLQQLAVPSHNLTGASLQDSGSKKQQQKRQILFENNIKSRTPSIIQVKQSPRSNSKNGKRQAPFKNTLQKGTENYFKLEIQNLQENTSKKFILCSEYEAHRNYKSDPNQAEKFFIQSLDGMLPQMKEILKFINALQSLSKDVNQTDNFLTEINSQALQTKNGYLQVICLLFHARLCFEYRDYVKTIHLAKKSKNLAQVYGYVYEKMKNYELIGQAYNAILKHNLSIIYYIKVLRLSWLLQNENQELKAYDQLGKCYYYLGDLDKAFYYHEKMMTGELERDQAIKQLSNSKLLNREYRSNIDIFRKKKNKGDGGYQYGEEIPEEDEYISSSDDEFEITVSIKPPLKENLISNDIDLTENEEGINLQRDSYKFSNKSKSSSSLGWSDRLIMARLKVFQIHRTKEMTNFQKNVSVTASDLQQDQVGKVECLMDMKNQEYLQKIFQQRGKATNMQKKYRISHLTPNRSILTYHEAESHFLKNKNYSSQQDFIPTIDSQNLKKINQIIVKFKSLMAETVVQISQTLANSAVFQMMSSNSLKLKQEFQSPKIQNNFQDQNDFKFKKMQEKENKYKY